MASVTGTDKVSKNLSKLEKLLFDAIDDATVATAGEIQREAIRSIAKQSPGKQVIRYKKGKSKKHTVSKPGDAPNTDEGGLVESIDVRHFPGTQTSYVFSDLDYSFVLETVYNRPWLKPAMIEKKKNLPENIKTSFKKILSK